MSYEDAIRVADLKTRRTRFERVHRETRAGQAQLVQINEFLHPRIQEMADVLPAAMGRWLLASGWARKFVGRFTRHGKIVQTTSLSGYCLLYLLASMRPWRRSSLRFREEQKKIEAWLARIPELARADYALALEVAECQQLVKGYGDTHANGSRNFNAIMDALPRLQLMKDAARRVKRLRDAALADDNGRKLEEALREVMA
jgi:indolepyruvate ferredoxin oxidoreductase beta subunit